MEDALTAPAPPPALPHGDILAEARAEYPDLTMSVAFDMMAYKKQQSSKSALELAPDIDEQTMMMIELANSNPPAGEPEPETTPVAVGSGAAAPPASVPEPELGETVVADEPETTPVATEDSATAPSAEGPEPELGEAAVEVTPEDAEPRKVVFGVAATSTSAKIIVDESSVPGPVDEAEIEVLWFPSGFLVDTFTKWRKTAVKDMDAARPLVWNITGLSPNTSYVFQVTVKGVGAALAKKTTPTGIPEFTVDALSPTSARVALAKGTEEPEKLVIEYQSTGYVMNGAWLRESLVKRSALTYEVQNLKPNTEYRFRVVRPTLKRVNMAKCYTLKEDTPEPGP